MSRDRAGEAGTSAARSSAILFIICLAIVLTPILAIKYPPLADYPNHLARLFILTHPDDPELAEYYRINWSLLPNLGFDLIGYGLAQVMPVELAGRAFLGIAFAVALSAPMALHRALYGRLSPLPLVAGALLFNLTVQMGFLSYFLGIGLAIWAFAIWLMCRRMHAIARFAVLQVAALIVFLCHLYAMAVLAILVVMHSASEGWRAAPDGFPARLNGAVKGAAPRALAFVLPLLLLLMASKTGSAGEGLQFNGLYAKLMMIPMSLMLDLSVFGLALAGVALLPALIAWRGGARMLHRAAVWPVVTLLLIYLPMPDYLLSSANADWRLIIPVVLVMVGAAEDPFRRVRGRVAIGLLAICVNFGAAYNAWTLWRGGDQIMSELRATLKHLPRGARLIPYQPALNFRTAFSPPSLLHVATYAVIERAAMVPTVFAIAGQQPIELKEQYTVAVEWHEWLQVGGPPPPEMARLTDPTNYVLEIRTDFDVTEPVPPLPLPADVVAQAEHFTLYRLRPGEAERAD